MIDQFNHRTFQLCRFVGNPDPKLAGEDDLRAGDQYCSCGESE